MERGIINKALVLEVSSIVENAPYVVDNANGEYTAVYSLRCASCQSQNCTGNCSSVPIAGELERKI